jgi:hypothetical protein
MLRERGSQAEREVDVLVEQRIGDIPVRLAVECRDRQRMSDVEWIDGLIGKYRDLPVDKVVAVSSSGFTQTALEKARANRIETRTLENALDGDWPQELLRVGFGRFCLYITTTKSVAVTEPKWDSASEPVAVSVGDRAPVPFKQWFDEVFHRISPTIAETVLREAKVLRDLEGGKEEVWEVGPRDTFVLSVEEHRAKLISLSVFTTVKLELQPVPVERRLYGDVGVTSAVVNEPSTKTVFKVTAVQAPRKELRPIVIRLPDEDA